MFALKLIQPALGVDMREPKQPENDPLLDFLPYCHKQPRSNSITPDVQRAFILELAATGIVKAAAAPVAPAAPSAELSIDDFMKVVLRIARIQGLSIFASTSVTHLDPFGPSASSCVGVTPGI